MVGNSKGRRNHPREARWIGDLDADSRQRGSVDRDTIVLGGSDKVDRTHSNWNSIEHRVVHVEEVNDTRVGRVHRSIGERSTALVVVGGVRKVPAEQRELFGSEGYVVEVAVQLLRLRTLRSQTTRVALLGLCERRQQLQVRWSVRQWTCVPDQLGYR